MKNTENRNIMFLSLFIALLFLIFLFIIVHFNKTFFYIKMINYTSAITSQCLKKTSKNIPKDSTNNVYKLYDPKLRKALDKNNPEVFIYHTFGFESYGKDENYVNKDDFNVCTLGDELKDELEDNYGIYTTNDKSVNESFNNTEKSYYLSEQILDKYCKNKNLKLIIDLNREKTPERKDNVVKINGENTARCTFFISRSNPYYVSNSDKSLKLMLISERLFPGYCKGVYYYNSNDITFNQEKSSKLICISIGSYVNTPDEAKNSVKYLARIIGEYINMHLY